MPLHPPVLPPYCRPPAAVRAHAVRPGKRRLPGASPSLLYAGKAAIGGQFGTLGLTFTPDPPPPPVPGYLQLAIPAGVPLMGRVTLSAVAPVDTLVGLTYSPPIAGAPGQVMVPKGSTWAGFTFAVPGAVAAVTRQEVDAHLQGQSLPLAWFYTAALPPPPPPTTDPRITGYADHRLQPLAPGAVAPGELVIQGQNFGTATGRVSYAGIPCSVTGWSDRQVIVVLPVSAMTSFQGPAGPPPPQGTLALWRSDGHGTTGPLVSAAVPAPQRPDAPRR